MLDGLKKIKQLKELQGILSQEKTEIEKDGVKIVVNGKLEVEEISINENLGKEKLEKVLKECFNEAVRKIQMGMAQKMSRMKGFGF